MPVITPKRRLSSIAGNFFRAAVPTVVAFSLVGGLSYVFISAAEEANQQIQKEAQVEQIREEKLAQARQRAEQRMAERREQEVQEAAEKQAQAIKDTEQRLLDAFNKGSKKVVLADGGIYALMTAEDIEGNRILSAHKITGTSEESNTMIIDQTPVVRISVPKPD